MNVLTPFSLRFWRALQHPPVYHSLFRRIAQQYFAQKPWTPFWSAWPEKLVTTLQLALMIAVLTALLTIPQLLTFVIFILPVFGTLLYIVLRGTISGLQQCLRVSTLIARARSQGMFDLLSLAPLGAFGVTWTLCTGSLYYGTQAGGSTQGQRVWISRLLFLAIILLINLMTTSSYRLSPVSPSATLFVSLLSVVLVGFCFFLDDMLSSVTGILIGLIVPMFTASPHVTRAAAGAVFILLQFAAYLLVWIIDFLLLPELLFAVYTPSLLTLVVLRLAQVGILFGLRDLLARGLWFLFKRLMDGQVVDTLVLMRGAPGAL